MISCQLILACTHLSCSDGLGRIFCALFTALERVKSDNVDGKATTFYSVSLSMDTGKQRIDSQQCQYTKSMSRIMPW